MKKGLISAFLIIMAIVIVIMVIANSSNPTGFTPIISTTATLNFPSTTGGASSDLTITLTGAVSGDVVILGVPSGSSVANGCFTAWVSAANTVNVRYSNNDLVTSYDPASGNFKVMIIKQ